MKKNPLIDKSGEVRELTRDDMRKFRPARDAVPHIVAAYKSGKLRTRGRPAGSSKSSISLRIDDDVLTFFKSKGPGWQTRIHKILKNFVESAR